MENPLKFYELKFKQYSEEYAAVSKLVDRYSIIRIFVFVLGGILLYFTTHFSLGFVLGYFLMYASTFGFIVYYHGKLHKKKNRLYILKTINSNEISALKGNNQSFDSGDEFISSNHFYSDDLDLFGEGSLFQYLNRTSTISGKKKLADSILNQELNQEKIQLKQEAISELAKEVSWRQNLQVLGQQTSETKKDIREIFQWLNEKPLFKNTSTKYLVYSIITITFSLLGLSLVSLIPPIIFILFVIIVPFWIVGLFFRRVNRIHSQLGQKSDLLLMYSSFIKEFERSNFKSAYLSGLKNKINFGRESGSEVLKKLSKITWAFNQRLNMIVGVLLNIFFLWDILQTLRLEDWKRKYKNLLPLWFDIIGEYDSLSSLGCYYFNNPNNSFPTFENESFELFATELGHPLILESDRINNDVKITGWAKFMIITGANMAGKSTFLRTLGVNMILASTGAPVCAKSFSWAPTQIFTSIRTKDSLFKNESYFFAELKRLKTLVDTLESGLQLFIILDEVLKGTNSKDKQTGSEKLINQLIKLNASGIIATHDLALGDLVNSHPHNIKNMRFEVEFVNNDLVFDYKLKVGISQNMNATFLMKKMGITI